MKNDDEAAVALAAMWKESKRRKPASAWGAAGYEVRLQAIEDCAHAVGLWQKFKNARDGKPIRDIPGQILFDAVPGFAVSTTPSVKMETDAGL